MGAAMRNAELLLDCGSGSPAPVVKLQGNKTAALKNEPGLKGKDIIFQVTADGACKRAAAAAASGCWCKKEMSPTKSCLRGEDVRAAGPCSINPTLFM